MLNPTQTRDRVLEIISSSSGFSAEELLGYSRQTQVMRARHVAVAVLYELGFSYPECARYLNRQGHNSAVNSVMVVKQSKDMSRDVVEIIRKIRGDNGIAE